MARIPLTLSLLAAAALGFEGLLYVAGMAFQKKTGKELPLFNSSCSYETFSNKAGWK